MPMPICRLLWLVVASRPSVRMFELLRFWVVVVAFFCFVQKLVFIVAREGILVNTMSSKINIFFTTSSKKTIFYISYNILCNKNYIVVKKYFLVQYSASLLSQKHAHAIIQSCIINRKTINVHFAIG